MSTYLTKFLPQEPITVKKNSLVIAKSNDYQFFKVIETQHHFYPIVHYFRTAKKFE
jgi:hypothetical protein